MKGDDTVSDGNGLEAGYKGAGIGARGPLGIFAVVILLLGGALTVIAYNGAQSIVVSNREGFALVRNSVQEMQKAVESSRQDHDLLGCIVSLTLDERRELRSMRAPADFRRLCPWLRLP